MTGTAFKRRATILRLPAEHQREARARILVWHLLRDARAGPARTSPAAPRAHPGGWYAPRKESA